jgi:hypothetical protein
LWVAGQCEAISERSFFEAAFTALGKGVFEKAQVFQHEPRHLWWPPRNAAASRPFIDIIFEYIKSDGALKSERDEF